MKTLKQMRIQHAILSILVLLMTVACDKQNNVSSNQIPPSGGIGGSNPAGAYPVPNAQTSQLIESFKGSNPCQTGARLPDMVFSLPVSFSGNLTKLEGQFMPGSVGGVVSNVYLGLSYYKDLLMVQKVTNGTQVTGYNVILSMCPFPPLLVPGRALSNFQAPMGINLIDSVGCGIGAATASLTRMDVAAFQTYQPTFVETTFAQPNTCQ